MAPPTAATTTNLAYFTSAKNGNRGSSNKQHATATTSPSATPRFVCIDLQFVLNLAHSMMFLLCELMIKLLNKCQTTAMIRSMPYWSHQHQFQHQNRHAHTHVHRHQHLAISPPPFPLASSVVTSIGSSSCSLRCWIWSSIFHFVNWKTACKQSMNVSIKVHDTFCSNC